MIEILPEGVIEILEQFGIAEINEPFLVELDEELLDSKRKPVVVWKRKEKSPTGS